MWSSVPIGRLFCGRAKCLAREPVMSKHSTVALGAASVFALAVIIGIVVLGDKRPTPTLAPPETSDPVVKGSSPGTTTAQLKYVPHLVPSLGAGPNTRPLAAPDAGSALEETSLLTKLHDLAALDPPQSLKLAKAAVERFPDSPNAPEFAWNVVKALYNMGRTEDAKEEARIMQWKYPGNYFTGDVDRHLLHPQPNSSVEP